MAANDLITVAEAKAAIGVDVNNTGKDAEIQSIVTAISNRLQENDLCGTLINTTITGERLSGSDAYGVQQTVVYLTQRPVVSVSSVIEWDGVNQFTLSAEQDATKTQYDYLLDTTRGTLLRRSGGQTNTWASGVHNIVVTYAAGRYANTAAVDPQVKEAAKMFFAHFWRAEKGAGSATFGAGEVPSFGPGYLIPNRVKELLGVKVSLPGFA